MLLRLLLSIGLYTLCACSLTTANGFESTANPLFEEDTHIVRLNEQPTRTPVASIIPLPEAARVSSGLGGVNSSVTLDPTTEARIVENLTDLDCQPPADWGIYIVTGGDTLYSISRSFNSNIPDIATANCLKDARRIEVGQALAVPAPNSVAQVVNTSERIIGVPQTVDIYMVSNSGSGTGTIPMGCGQYMVPVQVSIYGADTANSRVSNAINMLISDTSAPNNTINRLANSDLQVESVQIRGGVAQVSLLGNMPGGDDCSAPQIRAQIEQTILADHDVNTVTITLNGQPF